MLKRMGVGICYKSYREIQKAIVGALISFIRDTRGNCLTFTCKRLAVKAGLSTQPVLLTVIKHFLDKLCEKGLVGTYSRTSHGTKYIITRNSILWRLCASSTSMETVIYRRVLSLVEGEVRE